MLGSKDWEGRSLAALSESVQLTEEQWEQSGRENARFEEGIYTEIGLVAGVCINGIKKLISKDFTGDKAGQ